MHTRSLRAALLTSLGLIPLACQERSGPSPSACGESTPLVRAVATGLYLCENGLAHRPQPVICTSHLPRPLPAGADAGVGNEASVSQVEYLYPGRSTSPGGDRQCQADSDCTQHPLGYCAPFFGALGATGVACRYGCLTDDDCGAGALCECGDPVGQCIQASCRGDDDCADGMKCSEWSSEPVCTPTKYFSCQSSADECATSDDCGEGFCDGSSGVRKCEPPSGDVCGRPFLVSGEARVAELCGHADWASTGACGGELELAAEERALAAQHWARAALLEHASIAAFARFTLQLLQLAAPRELLEQSQLAMLDETAHARDCFDLASRYLQTAVGPGALPMQAALEETSLREITRLAFLEGCIGETVATIEAHEAHAGARDARVRQVLERIAADEQRHAELAWRFVRWALQLDPGLRTTLERELARIEAELAGASVVQATPELPAHGVLGAQRLEQVRRAALAEVVLPCARALLQQAEPSLSAQSALRA